jgi:hypothetical protein
VNKKYQFNDVNYFISTHQLNSIHFVSIQFVQWHQFRPDRTFAQTFASRFVGVVCLQARASWGEQQLSHWVLSLSPDLFGASSNMWRAVAGLAGAKDALDIVL